MSLQPSGGALYVSQIIEGGVAAQEGTLLVDDQVSNTMYWIENLTNIHIHINMHVLKVGLQGGEELNMSAAL